MPFLMFAKRLGKLPAVRPVDHRVAAAYLERCGGLDASCHGFEHCFVNDRTGCKHKALTFDSVGLTGGVVDLVPKCVDDTLIETKTWPRREMNLLPLRI